MADESFDLSGLVDEFRDEATEQVPLLEAAAHALEGGGQLADAERERLLRALHTLKGNSAMLGFLRIRDYVHTVESFFRDLPDPVPAAAVEALLDGAGALRSAIAAAGGEDEDEVAERLAALPPIPRRPDAASEGDAAGAGTSPSTAEAGSRAEEEDAEAAGTDFLRVPSGQLDRLLDEVGQLGAFGTSIARIVREERRELRGLGIGRSLEDLTEQLLRAVGALQDEVLDLRLVPAKRTLARYPAVARQIARGQDKKVRLTLEGEQTRIDKGTLEGLAEPLLHLVRNAVDHGIETPEERKRKGKPEEGAIGLALMRTGDRIEVVVEDDGRGLDRAEIVARARGRGLLDPGQEPSDAEAAELLFRAGFSTRDAADTVSGRGIGLDVVQRRVSALRGSVVAESRANGGTRFRIRIPLRVTIVPVVLFENGERRFAIPAHEVLETVRHPQTEKVGPATMVHDRDDLIPLVDPAAVFGWSESNGAAPHFAIVVRAHGRSAAVPGSRVLDQRDAVMKPLPESLGHLVGVSGVALSGEGEPILVLDPTGLLELNLDLHRRKREH